MPEHAPIPSAGTSPPPPTDKLASLKIAEEDETEQLATGHYDDPEGVTSGCEEEEPRMTLDDLRAELRVLFSEDKVDVDAVQLAMEKYQSNISDWRDFAKWDPFRYTRNLVDDGNGRYNLMILCWNESQGSSIHSHAGSHCFMKVIAGQLREEKFPWPVGSDPDAPVSERQGEALGPLSPTAETDLKLNEVAYIHDKIGLHRIENASHTDRAASLHLYCPPFSECSCFDQRTGRENKAQVTFFSKFGRRTGIRPRVSVVQYENN